MKSMTLPIACLVAVTATDLAAASITTLFAADNGGSVGGAVYFDIDVLDPLGLTLQKVFLNSGDTGVSASLDVYTRSGTFVGFETSSTGWTLASSGTGTILGLDLASEFDIIDFGLPQGVTGIALVASSNDWRHSYTNGTGANQNYANSDLTLSLGAASNTPFTSAFTPRVWNGTIEYSAGSSAPAVVPLPPSLAILAGSIGLAGAVSALGRRKARRSEG